MVYAFSRDGALPLSRLWHKVNGHEVPTNAVWLSCFMAFVMALPVWHSSPLISWNQKFHWMQILFLRNQPDIRVRLAEWLPCNDGINRANASERLTSCCAVTVSWQRGRLPSHGVDFHSRSVHLVCFTHILPNHSCPSHLCAGACAFGTSLGEPHRGLGGGVMGRHHHHPLLLAGALPCGHSVAELHARCCWGCPGAGPLVLAAECPQVVQGASTKCPWLHLWWRKMTHTAVN